MVFEGKSSELGILESSNLKVFLRLNFFYETSLNIDTDAFLIKY